MSCYGPLLYYTILYYHRGCNTIQGIPDIKVNLVSIAYACNKFIID
jgi:hypothetical protein